MRGRLAAGMSCTVKAGLVWIGLDHARTVGRSTAERAAVGPSPGSIFPGCFVHGLHWDCDGIPDCNEILRIVCRGLWLDFGG